MPTTQTTSQDTGHETEIRNSQMTSSNEDQIRQALEDFESAFESRDLEALMALYSDDIIAFDETEQLAYEGKEAYRKVWQNSLENSSKISLKVRDLKVRVDQNVAFVHFLGHTRTSSRDGQNLDHWARCTLGFLKQSGKWLISHEHISVPFDFNTGDVLWDAEPARVLKQ